MNNDRETDALANMMGADSRRIDELVGDVGAIKGDVRGLKSDTQRIGSGVDQLQQSMAVLGRHAVLMETQSAEISSLRTKHDGLDTRIRVIEADMPALRETRSAILRGVFVVLGVVGMAVLALVIKR